MKRFFDLLAAIAIALLVVMLLAQFQSLLGQPATWFEQLNIFATIFLGIFIEAAPFLLLGTLASGLVEVFLNPAQLHRFAPRRPLTGALMGGLLGMAFPVCECGVIPLTRRLFRKGLPPAVGVAFLLASPVINPIVIASTAAAFGWGPVLWLRLGLSFAIAATVGLVFSLQTHPERLFLPAALPAIGGGSGLGSTAAPLPTRLGAALRIAGDEFFEMGKFLVAGAGLAALMQTFVPQTALLALGSGPLLSALALMALAVLLSICSTVDAFIALAFTGAFSTGSILGFLVFGPMVDIKSTLLYMQVFPRRVVVYIILLPFLMSLLAAVFINLFTTL